MGRSASDALLDSADCGLSGELGELPFKDIRLECAASEDKECPPQGGLNVGYSEDQAALTRVMRYLLARSESWHQQPSEGF